MASDEPLTIAGLAINPLITQSIVKSVEDCLQMCNMKVNVVGITRIPVHLPQAPVTGMIGLSGKCTGFISLTMPERVAVRAVSGLLMDELKTINSAVVDGVGEMTNIVAGGLKTKLYNTAWMVNHITIPSVILGDNYNISFTKGIDYCGITFETEDAESLSINDRVFMVTTSLIQTVN